ncbi:hypothetical protein Igag_1260 [Ignisphaera aggregans DSM 17230]|uniref:Uncharacterized protein n=1 Tax=Ignisphaera aggregans (strain DSM 17230 / JCM 13409 / AQ1.S1) TaxID=583356 RepID=E0SPL0_IGNAA|nr:hypothetical protein Igag_1260 [Ignisphaera aggregans DSM 17230]
MTWNGDVHMSLFDIDDIAICAYSLCGDSLEIVKEYIDCIPESLNAIHRIAESLGIKIRFSTVEILQNYVKNINELREEDIEKLISIIRRVASNRNISLEEIEEILKIVFGRKLHIFNKKSDLIEISFAALYALFLNILNSIEDKYSINQIYIPIQENIAIENIIA